MRLAADLGQFLVSPGFGGLAVLVAAAIAVRTGREQLAAGREAAAVARVQGRKADAYLSVLHNTQQIGRWAETVQPSLAETLPQTAADGHLTARASLAAFGTPEVRELWEAWRARRDAVQDAIRMIGLYESDRVTFRDSAADALRRRTVLDDEGSSGLRKRERAGREALGAQMNVELAERPLPPRRRWRARPVRSFTRGWPVNDSDSPLKG